MRIERNFEHEMSLLQSGKSTQRRCMWEMRKSSARFGSDVCWQRRTAKTIRTFWEPECTDNARRARNAWDAGHA